MRATLAKTVRTPRPTRPGVEELEDRQVPATIFALNAAGTSLLRFDSATPNTVATVGTIGSLGANESVVGIDFRPAIGMLYGVVRDSMASGNNSRVVVINTATAATTAVGTGNTFALDVADRVSIDFNPTVDRIRVVTDDPVGTDDDNFRINPDNGAVAGTDANLFFAAGDVSTGNPKVVAIAYTNNFTGATSTTLYDIDSGLDRLLVQGGLGGLPSPNTGKLFTAGGLGENTLDSVGLDITAGNMTFASLTLSGETDSRLYTIPELSFGAVSPTPATTPTANIIGGAGFGTIRDIAVAPAGVFNVSAATVTAQETDASVTLTVNRQNGSDGTATVDWSITGGTADKGQDFTGPLTGTLTFLNGETTKTITIPLKYDFLQEGDETIVVSLSKATGGAAVGATSMTTVTIQDVPPGPGPVVADGFVNVSASVGVVKGPPRPAGNGLVRRTVTLTNTSTTTFRGSLFLVLNNLTPGVELRSASGASQNVAPGKKYVLVPLNNQMLAPGASVTVDLLFRVNGSQTPNFVVRSYAGGGVF